MSDDKPALYYTGDGRFLVGIPARNLTAVEAKAFRIDWLVRSGLYSKDDPQKGSGR